MASSPLKVLTLSVCLLVFIDLPARADPFFVRVYGRTYKVDPRYASDEPKGPTPQEAMKALPSDIARGPGFKPSHEQVLAEVEERLWIARNQLDEELDETAASREWRNTAVDTKAVRQEITGSLETGTPQPRSPELQKRYDRLRALNLLVRELRRSMDLPMKPPGAEFSRPKLSPEIESSYRDLNFDPIAAYYGFRRVKAAFRSGDVELLARVVHYPLAVTGKVRRTIRTRDQLVVAKETVMDPHVRAVVAKFDLRDGLRPGQGDDARRGRGLDRFRQAGFGLGMITVGNDIGSIDPPRVQRSASLSGPRGAGDVPFAGLSGGARRFRPSGTPIPGW